MNNEYFDLFTDSSLTTAEVYTANSAMGGLFGALFGALAGMAVVIFVVGGIISIISIIANWVLFKKAGEKGWKSIIPIYNTITLFKIAGVSPWLILGYFSVFIPIIGTLACIGITIYVMISLAKAFGKGAGFTVGLILLNAIFIMILAFGDSEYQLNKVVSEIPETKE